MTTGGFAESVADINEIRTRDPRRIKRLLASRRKRQLLGPDGKLMIIACDHPARGALGAAGRKMAMASRTELLDRLVTALARPGVDGLLATADIAEDLLLLGALEDKVVFASTNRGGLQGSSFEMDDRNTGYDVPGVIESGFDGAKMLVRIDLDDPGTVATLEQCGRDVSALNRAELIAMVEPFMSGRKKDKIVNDLSPDAVIKSVHIAQGLGASSAFTWLKLPVVHEMERVMDATTLPTLLLGGDPEAAPDETYAAWRAALQLPSVRGLVVGRTMLYPADDDVAKAVDTAVRSGAMSKLYLPAGSAGSAAYEVEITPESAGWGYSSLRIISLPVAGTDAFETGDDEVIIVPLSGAVSVEADGSHVDLDGRASVFAGPTDVVYIGIGQTVTLHSERGGRFAVCGARSEKSLPLRYLSAAKVPVELRGAGQASRQVRNFGTPDALPASTIIACEVITPGRQLVLLSRA